LGQTNWSQAVKKQELCGATKLLFFDSLRPIGLPQFIKYGRLY